MSGWGKIRAGFCLGVVTLLVAPLGTAQGLGGAFGSAGHGPSSTISAHGGKGRSKASGRNDSISRFWVSKPPTPGATNQPPTGGATFGLLVSTITLMGGSSLGCDPIWTCWPAQKTQRPVESKPSGAVPPDTKQAASSPPSVSLGEFAREQRERKLNTPGQPVRVFTNDDLPKP